MKHLDIQSPRCSDTGKCINPSAIQNTLCETSPLVLLEATPQRRQPDSNVVNLTATSQPLDPRPQERHTTQANTAYVKAWNKVPNVLDNRLATVSVSEDTRQEMRVL